MQNEIVVTIVRLLLTGVSVLIVSKVLPGIKVKSFGSAVFFAVMVSIFNAIAWHFFGLLTIPFAVLTAGIGALLLNGLIFMAADKVVSGVEISGCLTAILASLGVTLVNWVLGLFFGSWAP